MPTLRFNVVDSMRSICDLGTDDVLRLCSAVLDVLDTEGCLERELTQMNYLYRIGDVV